MKPADCNNGRKKIGFVQTKWYHAFTAAALPWHIHTFEGNLNLFFFSFCRKDKTTGRPIVYCYHLLSKCDGEGSWNHWENVVIGQMKEQDLIVTQAERQTGKSTLKQTEAPKDNFQKYTKNYTFNKICIFSLFLFLLNKYLSSN